MIRQLTLATLMVVSGPLRKDAIPEAVLPPFPSAAAGCRSIAPSVAHDPFLSVGLIARPDRVSFITIVYGFLLQGRTHDDSGEFYVKLDHENAELLGFVPMVSKSGTQVAITFPGLKPGHHMLDFGIISATSSTLSYGRICFEVKPRIENRYSFPETATPGPRSTSEPRHGR